MNKKLLLSLILIGVFVLSSCTQKKTLPIKPPKHGGVYVVAHRGAHLEEQIPENSIPAYQKAIDIGADFVEIDVRMTKDGKFVSCHNSEVGKYVVGGHPGKISEMTLAEIKQLDIGSRVSEKWKGTQIPTFDEILDLCKGKIGIYLDLKNAPVEPLIEKIRARGMEQDVLWYADNVELEEVKSNCSKCVIMPDPGPEKNLVPLIERFHPDVIAAVWKYMSASFMTVSHDAGAIVIVDDGGPESWQQALDWGLDGIQSDHPAELIKFLENRK